MPGFYTRDKVKITPVTRDVGTGEETRGASIEVEALVEDTSEVISDNGRRVEADAYILLDPSVTIEKGYYLQIVEQFGEAVTKTERLVISAQRYGLFNKGHWEVYI